MKSYAKRFWCVRDQLKFRVKRIFVVGLTRSHSRKQRPARCRNTNDPENDDKKIPSSVLHRAVTITDGREVRVSE